jgi:hypothetical protein
MHEHNLIAMRELAKWVAGALRHAPRSDKALEIYSGEIRRTEESHPLFHIPQETNGRHSGDRIALYCNETYFNDDTNNSHAISLRLKELLNDAAKKIGEKISFEPCAFENESGYRRRFRHGSYINNTPQQLWRVIASAQTDFPQPKLAKFCEAIEPCLATSWRRSKLGTFARTVNAVAHRAWGKMKQTAATWNR